MREALCPSRPRPRRASPVAQSPVEPSCGPGAGCRARPSTRPAGGSTPSDRTGDLSPDEVAELAQLIADGRLGRHAVEMPVRLRARSWTSVEQVLSELERRLGWTPAGWKIGAASMEVRRAEDIPSPSPGRIFSRTVFDSPAALAPELFVNSRLCECEFAFELGADFPARDEPYSEDEVRAGGAPPAPGLEIGDSG